MMTLADGTSISLATLRSVCNVVGMDKVPILNQLPECEHGSGLVALYRINSHVCLVELRVLSLSGTALREVKTTPHPLMALEQSNGALGITPHQYDLIALRSKMGNNLCLWVPLVYWHQKTSKRLNLALAGSIFAHLPSELRSAPRSVKVQRLLSHTLTR